VDWSTKLSRSAKLMFGTFNRTRPGMQQKATRTGSDAGRAPAILCDPRGGAMLSDGPRASGPPKSV